MSGKVEFLSDREGFIDAGKTGESATTFESRYEGQPQFGSNEATNERSRCRIGIVNWKTRESVASISRRRDERNFFSELSLTSILCETLPIQLQRVLPLSSESWREVLQIVAENERKTEQVFGQENRQFFQTKIGDFGESRAKRDFWRKRDLDDFINHPNFRFSPLMPLFRGFAKQTSKKVFGGFSRNPEKWSKKATKKRPKIGQIFDRFFDLQKPPKTGKNAIFRYSNYYIIWRRLYHFSIEAVGKVERFRKPFLRACRKREKTRKTRKTRKVRKSAKFARAENAHGKRAENAENGNLRKTRKTRKNAKNAKTRKREKVRFWNHS